MRCPRKAPRCDGPDGKRPKCAVCSEDKIKALILDLGNVVNERDALKLQVIELQKKLADVPEERPTGPDGTPCKHQERIAVIGDRRWEACKSCGDKIDVQWTEAAALKRIDEVCDSCGWNNGPNHGGGSRVMHMVGKVTKCGSCFPTTR